MAKYILSHRGYGDQPAKVMDLINRLDTIKVIDRLGNDIIVTGRAVDVRDLAKRLKGWTPSPERRIRNPRQIPNTRRQKAAGGSL